MKTIHRALRWLWRPLLYLFILGVILTIVPVTLMTHWLGTSWHDILQAYMILGSLALFLVGMIIIIFVAHEFFS